MPIEDPNTDSIQTMRINHVERQVERHEARLADVERSVVVIGSDIRSQNATLEQIKAGTTELGAGFRADLTSMREAQATERREEREAVAAAAAADRASAAAWWSSMFKLAGAVVTVLGGIATAGAVATGSVPGLSKAPVAISAPAP